VNEQVAEILRASVHRERGHGDGEPFANGVEQSGCYGADVAGGGGIEGAAVFELPLARIEGLGGVECGKRLRNGFLGGGGAGFEGNDGGIEAVEEFGAGQSEGLNGADAFGVEHAGEVGTAGEVVGDGGKQELVHRDS
jgi:hypothetical protein